MVINVSVQYNGGFLPDIILLTQDYLHPGTRLRVPYTQYGFLSVFACLRGCLKKNQNAPRPSEHPPVMGEKCQNV